MRVLIACEYSGRMREEVRKLGHFCVSCDFEPAEDNSPHHYQGDVKDILHLPWDIIIAHPTCTRLTNAGVRWLHKPPEGRTLEDIWKELDEGAAFFKLFLDRWKPGMKVIVENPVMHKYAKERIGGRPHSFSAQPYEHGDNATKRTCFWTIGEDGEHLPPLLPTNLLPKPEGGYPQPIWLASPGPNRWKERSRSFLGICRAVVSQYVGPVEGGDEWTSDRPIEDMYWEGQR